MLAALTICARILENGGTFVAKVFRGREAGLLGAQLRCLFTGEVAFAKPSSSRNSSLESFVVCRNFRGDTVLPPSLTSTTATSSESNDNSVDSFMGWLNGFDQVSAFPSSLISHLIWYNFISSGMSKMFFFVYYLFEILNLVLR